MIPSGRSTTTKRHYPRGRNHGGRNRGIFTRHAWRALSWWSAVWCWVFWSPVWSHGTPATPWCTLTRLVERNWLDCSSWRRRRSLRIVELKMLIGPHWSPVKISSSLFRHRNSPLIDHLSMAVSKCIPNISANSIQFLCWKATQTLNKICSVNRTDERFSQGI